MASKLADAFAPEYQSSGPEWLRMIGAIANRVRGNVPSPTDVLGFAPGGGMAEAGTQNYPKAYDAYKRGDTSGSCGGVPGRCCGSSAAG